MAPKATTCMVPSSQLASDTGHTALKWLIENLRCEESKTDTHSCMATLLGRLGSIVVDLGLPNTKLLLQSHPTPADKLVARLITLTNDSTFPALQSLPISSTDAPARHQDAGKPPYYTVVDSVTHKHAEHTRPLFEMVENMLHSGTHGLTSGLKDIWDSYAHQMSIITVINHTRHRIARTDESVYKGEILSTFTELGPNILLDHTPDVLVGLGIWASNNGYTSGAAGAIELTVKVGDESMERIVVASAAPTFGKRRTYMVSVNHDSCKDLAEKNDANGAGNEGSTKNAQRLHKSKVDLSVELESDFRNYAHVVVRFSEPASGGPS